MCRAHVNSGGQGQRDNEFTRGTACEIRFPYGEGILSGPNTATSEGAVVVFQYQSIHAGSGVEAVACENTHDGER